MQDGRQPEAGRVGRCIRAGAITLLLLAPGCSRLPSQLDPVDFWSRFTGRADQNRLPPPGLDRPVPSLASVPPRPERPPIELRSAITEALSDDRASSREPLVLRTVPAPGAAPATPSGDPSMPGTPPPRPALAAAPAIPWAAPAPRPEAPGRRPEAAPATPALPDMPRQAPAAPPPELLGPPPRPGAM
ncbi:hypothetical protein [Roseicella aquatilis]|uniref:Uncharacterized protein n=1 Tax=Roseicella aquatilis TaxID=2527868 RepID=A0A4R4DU96_9PROT|nr:hypothetical protein [Roseicella aquatilis]TCZ66672.1 hypothetical protein EXY23_00730 [Roseicella aquatilis]